MLSCNPCGRVDVPKVQPCREQVPFTCLLFDICVWGEHPVEVIESPLVDGRGVVHEQLLNLQPIRDLFQAQHVVD
jgi:hypothetical protein